MASTQARIGQQALVVLDVALRVPCIFIIDAIFNSYYDPGSGWAGAMGKVLVRVLGEFLLFSPSGLRICHRELTGAALAVTSVRGVELCYLCTRAKADLKPRAHTSPVCHGGYLLSDTLVPARKLAR